MANIRLVLLTTMLSALAATSVSATDVPGRFFRTEIQPVLARCAACHHGESPEGGLRLDTAAGLLRGGESGPAVVAGKPDDSLLIRLVRGTPERRMPPDSPLSKTQIASLAAWVKHGVPWPASVTRIHPILPAKSHWAFQPVTAASPLDVENEVWPAGPIDSFVLARLEHEEVAPSPRADRNTLLRRVTLDLTGLPPTLAQLKEFRTDQRPGSYERLVDRLLASPHFGERWGRHWLDLARYADSTGYEADKPRQIWAYRDWVIRSLNDDLSFDQFVTEQLAGDLLPDATLDQKIATGFHCNAMFDPGVREEHVIDRVATTGAVFLGLTLGCAQCHSHKTDPVSHSEFYQLYAFFNEAVQSELPLSFVGAKDKDGKSATTLILKTKTAPTHIFLRGDRRQPGEKVTPGVPEFLHTLEINKYRYANRLDLARWLMSRENPLTARVTANRIWQRLFGRGLVATPDDFGLQTPPPSHPRLLDWLAIELQTTGWQMKSLLRQIVLSETYRQSSDVSLQLAALDPDNVLLARQRRLRVEAEIIRDLSLATSGLLSAKMSGPGVFPWQPEGVLNNRATPATWTVSAGEDRYRRGIYTWVWRLTPHPHLPLFNAPDGVTSCSRRDRSNVAVQALTLLNDPIFIESARHLAVRVLTETEVATASRINQLFEICLSRRATKQEQVIVESLLTRQWETLTAAQASALLGQKTPATAAEIELAAWTVVCRAVLNLDEFITRE